MSQPGFWDTAVPSSDRQPLQQHPQDSPTTGRQQIHTATHSAGQGTKRGFAGPLPSPPRSQRRPAPSPLHSSSAVSPPSSPGPTRSHFSRPPSASQPRRTPLPIATTVGGPRQPPQAETGKTSHHSDSSCATTPEATSSVPDSSPRFGDETYVTHSPSVLDKPLTTSPVLSPSPAGPAGSHEPQLPSGMPRTSSIDSAISAVSKSYHHKMASEGDVELTDIASLVKSAGSAEAVIQHLLKEKQSQSQQNSQLWRLVDKQRAMIIGLNKDLERALKDKEKYRKKLKEVIGAPPYRFDSTQQATQRGSTGEGMRDAHLRTESESQGSLIFQDLELDGHNVSPVDATSASYPNFSRAEHSRSDQSSEAGDILAGSQAVGKPSESTLAGIQTQRSQQAESARTLAGSEDPAVNFSLPPSRRMPSEAPRAPPPRTPAAPPSSASTFGSSQSVDDGASQFPPPSVPPHRKLPPTPLQLSPPPQSPAMLIEDELDSESEYDDILEVDEEAQTGDGRGRRRTRLEDEHDRETGAREQAETRSLSVESEESNYSLEEMPSRAPTEVVELQGEVPPSPRLVPSSKRGAHKRDDTSGSLAGVLSGDAGPETEPSPPSGLRGQGPPSGPRPLGMKPSIASPPLSPLGVAGFAVTSLSPRPPHPPNTPLQTPLQADVATMNPSTHPVKLRTSARSLHSSPTMSSHESATERTTIYKGLVTDEYPDLLLPPNALPSVDMKVASSRMKPSRASLMSLTQLEEDPVFTLAIFSRADGGELWRVEKDIASLFKLDQRLKQCSAFAAKAPERSLFTGHAPAKLDARRLALDQYLEELLNTPLDNATAVELCRYLSTNTLPPNADETGSPPSANASGPDQKAGPGGRPSKAGYLTKRGKNFGGWKARFFILDGPSLKYYETPGGAHLGTIRLQRAQVSKQSQHSNDGSSLAHASSAAEEFDNQFRHALLILEPKKKDPNSLTKHVLCAESDRERDQWVEDLMRWVDYRDPDDDEPPPKREQAHSRHGSGPDRLGGGISKKRAHNQAKHQPQHVAENEDTLIGVSYDATHPGEAPQGAPSRSRASGGHHQQESQQSLTSAHQQAYMISAPRDPHLISDSASWGSKLAMGVNAPGQDERKAGQDEKKASQDEKKARKRSFFGFGPKTRSSSDGQDSLLGSDSGSIHPGQLGGLSSGPVRPVFGATLGEAVKYSPPSDVRVPLPAVVYRCIQFLDANNAILEEGIFRLSGSNLIIRQLRERFNNEGDINLLTDEHHHDIHAVASLLKLYLRELPTTILTRELHAEFLSVIEMTNQKNKIAALAELVERLPQANATLLQYLIAFLIRIINHQDVNKMSVRNVGIVFSPTLNIPAPVFAVLLQNYEAVFGIGPEDYELPILVPDGQRRASNPERLVFQDRRPSDSQRPSTAGTGSSSPRRQRLTDAVTDGQSQRSSPTPPPSVMSMQQMAQLNAAQLRSSPTPPLQRSASYDFSYVGQQNPAAADHATALPASEAGAGVASGYESGRAASEAGSLTPHDQPPYSVKSRRESVMFAAPANVSHQVSKSRLREETQL